MIRVKVYVTLKEGVLDPQGKAVTHALQNLGHEGVEEVRVGKYMELTLNSSENVEEQVETMCHSILANPVIESYRYEIEEVVSQ